jgi:hypothetical protein
MDYEVDIDGGAIPAWLISLPSAVVDVTIGDHVVTFEQLFSSVT